MIASDINLETKKIKSELGILGTLLIHLHEIYSECEKASEIFATFKMPKELKENAAKQIQNFNDPKSKDFLFKMKMSAEVAIEISKSNEFELQELKNILDILRQAYTLEELKKTILEKSEGLEKIKSYMEVLKKFQ